jgi:hypothetical protein
VFGVALHPVRPQCEGNYSVVVFGLLPTGGLSAHPIRAILLRPDLYTVIDNLVTDDYVDVNCQP